MAREEDMACEAGKCVAVVTGAAHGIGRAVAEMLLERGARVFCGDVTEALGAQRGVLEFCSFVTREF